MNNWFKKALKHIAVGAISLGVVAGAVFGFAGCGPTNTPTPTPPGPGPQPDPPIVKPDPPIDDTYKNVDFSEFLEKYKTEGVEFFNDYVKSSITSGKGDILAESINFDTLQDEFALDHVSYAYIYKNGDTARKYDVVDVQFSAPIKFDDILNKEVDQNKVIPITQTALSFDFDAKEIVEKSELADALSQRMQKSDSGITANANKYLAAVEKGSISSGEPTLKYRILFEDNNKFFVDTIRVYDKEFDEAQLIENLLDDAKYNKMRCGAGFGSETNLGKLQGENIFKSEYEAEFQKEGPGPVTPGKEIKDMNDLVTNYSTELNQGLQGAYDHIVEKVLPNQMDGSRFSANKLSDTKWNLETDANGSISKVNYVGKYNTLGADYIYFITSVTLNNPISLNELTDKNLVTELQKAINNDAVTYKYELNFNFNENSQPQYQALAEAVFEKEGLKEEGSTYYISSVTPSVSELGNTKIASVLQVSNKGVKRISIEVKDDGNDLVENIRNGQYKASNKTSYDFGQYTLDAETNKVATTSFSPYNEGTGKYNIKDFGDEILF